MIDRTRLISEMLAAARRTWHPRYDGEAREIAGFVAARVEAALGPRSHDCVITFERASLDAEWITNPLRGHAVRPGGYPQLRSLLASSSIDSVPLAVASSGAGTVLWDGHRRLETYRAAGRPDVPVWHARFLTGSGSVRVAST